MRSVRMTAKKAGRCTNCGQAIVIGQTIFWARGAGAHHANCTIANQESGKCAACSGKGMSGWYGNTPCSACDGTGRRKNQLDKAFNGEDYPCSDRGYEDECARRCGF